jgi:hypothetical protein
LILFYGPDASKNAIRQHAIRNANFPIKKYPTGNPVRTNPTLAGNSQVCKEKLDACPRGFRRKAAAL